jgi:histone acetyltransferase (RNA polymerase elongator complex component)
MSIASKTDASIIPIFLPQMGCAHRCIYCNQRAATGVTSPPSPDEVSSFIRKIVNGNPGKYTVALYGGSVSALPDDELVRYLSAIRDAQPAGNVAGIRLSTRPDAISPKKIQLFKEYSVTTVELGAQSLDNAVLERIERGHDALCVRRATELLKSADIAVGIHLMLGLPGQSAESFHQTVEETVTFAPDTVRLHPTLVLEDTVLAELWRRGEYEPLSLEETVEECAWAYGRLRQAGIAVIRMGLQEVSGLRLQVLAGPHHPAFGELVISRFLRELVEEALMSRTNKDENVIIKVSPRALSLFIGQKRSNLKYFQERLGVSVEFTGDEGVEGYEFKMG